MFNKIKQLVQPGDPIIPYTPPLSEAREEDCVQSVASGHTILGSGEPAFTVGEFAGALRVRDLEDA